jgi:hypothetical protein
MRVINLRLVAAGCLLGAFLSSLTCLVVKSTWKARASVSGFHHHLLPDRSRPSSPGRHHRPPPSARGAPAGSSEREREREREKERESFIRNYSVPGGPRLSTLGKARAVTEQRQPTHEPHVYTAAGSPSHRGSPWSASHFEQFFDQMSQDKADPAPLRVHDLFEGEDESEAGNGEFGSYGDFGTLLRYIWHAQHPRDCSSARLLILTSHWKQGPGSALHIRVCVSHVCVFVSLSLSLSRALSLSLSRARSLSLALSLSFSLSLSLSLSLSVSLYVFVYIYRRWT